MTVTATGAFTTGTGNGATKAFPFSFFAPDPTQVQVYLAGALQSSGYSVTTLPGQGGTVTFDVAPANGVAVLAALAPNFEQLVNFADGPFLPTVVDNALDQAATRDIYLNAKADRALRAPVGDAISELPASASRANMFLGFDASGNPVPLSGTGADAGLRTDLAASTGASLVAYLPDPTGIAALSLQSALRLGLPVTPFHFGAVGDGVTDDHVALAAFNTWAFASVRSNKIDWTGTFATTQTVTIGPSVATDQNGPRYNVGGNLRIVATAAMDVIIKPLNLRSITWHGRFEAIGTGSSTWSGRTCGIGILPTNCANSTFTGGFKVQNTYYQGVLNLSDATNFSDGMHIGFITAEFCGSGITTSNLAQTANWSSPVNSSTSGAFNQLTTLTVDSMPPVLIDTYSTWGSNQAAVVINGEPYAIESIDRVNSTISIFRWLDSAVLAVGSGTLNYIYGGGYTAHGADSGIIKVDHLQLVDCGIGLSERSLYGSRISSAIIEGCGIALALGAGKNSAHIGSSCDAIYVEDNTFDVCWFGAMGANDFSYVTSTYNVDPTRCWSLADPRFSNDLYGGSSGTFGTHSASLAPEVSALTLAIGGRLHSFHASSQHNPITSGTVYFYGHTRAPEPKFYDANSLTIQLVNAANGAWNRIFGFRYNVLWISGSGTNEAPTGTIAVNPPTQSLAGCTTTSSSTTVTVPLLGMGTRGLVAGMPVSGTGIPAGATIASITDRTHFVLSAAATAPGTVTLTITGMLNGGVVPVSYSGFGGVVGLLIAHIDPWEMQWECFVIDGKHRLNVTALGYSTGAGGAVTQATNKSTSVTLNKLSGQMTMNNAALAAGAAVGFTLTNSQIAATDTVIVNIASGASASSYTVTVDAVAAGSCHILLHNISAGSLSEAAVLNFSVLKAVAA